MESIDQTIRRLQAEEQYRLIQQQNDQHKRQLIEEEIARAYSKQAADERAVQEEQNRKNWEIIKLRNTEMLNNNGILWDMHNINNLYLREERKHDFLYNLYIGKAILIWGSVYEIDLDNLRMSSKTHSSWYPKVTADCNWITVETDINKDEVQINHPYYYNSAGGNAFRLDLGENEWRNPYIARESIAKAFLNPLRYFFQCDPYPKNEKDNYDTPG